LACAHARRTVFSASFVNDHGDNSRRRQQPSRLIDRTDARQPHCVDTISVTVVQGILQSCSPVPLLACSFFRRLSGYPFFEVPTLNRFPIIHYTGLYLSHVTATQTLLRRGYRGTCQRVSHATRNRPNVHECPFDDNTVSVQSFFFKCCCGWHTGFVVSSNDGKRYLISIFYMRLLNPPTVLFWIRKDPVDTHLSRRKKPNEPEHNRNKQQERKTCVARPNRSDWIGSDDPVIIKVWRVVISSRTNQSWMYIVR